MVSRMTQDRLVGRFAGDWERELSRNARPMSFQHFDVAIAQLARSLRILLNLDLPSNSDNLAVRSNDMSTETSSANTSDRYDVLVVENYEDGAGAEKANWTRIGVAFPHKDGNGLNVELRAIPVSGKLVIRRHEAKLKPSAS
jgi:hypothetical protein